MSSTESLPSRPFTRAVSVWAPSLAGRMNVEVSFHASVSRPRATPLSLRVAAASVYRIWINGEFLGQGPARAPHGHARIDTWSVPATHEHFVTVVIEVVAYGVPSFCEALGPAFCCAELELAGRVVAWTAPDEGGFVAEHRRERVQRVERFSYQRAFCEAYRLDAAGLPWLAPGYRPAHPLPLAHEPTPSTWLPRGTAYPCMDLSSPNPVVARGDCVVSPEKITGEKEYRFLHRVPEISQGFPLSTVEWPLYETVSRLRYDTAAWPDHPAQTHALSAGQWARWDFGAVKTGFPVFQITARKNTRIIGLFDELLVDGSIQFDRLDCLAAFWVEIAAGASAELQLFEPGSLRYLQLVVIEGDADISRVRLRNFISSVPLRPEPVELPDTCRDIRRAAIASYRQNVLDIYMDCPSRERAGWLCDSFYMARAEWYLTGDNTVEVAFLENYLLPECFDGLPAGMVPMCYPAEILNREFIPNWAMFLVLQLDEATRLRRLPANWRPLITRRVRGILDCLARFENEHGLLENLDGWIFVEWSKANDLVRDVNFPTNILYAAMLASAARLLDDAILDQKARHLRDMIRRLAWRDGRFVDNAIRLPSGELAPTDHASEVCQYYALYFGLLKPDDIPDLWSRLLREDYGELYPATALHGKLYRLELLINRGETAAAQKDLARLYEPMARQTGTLWEHLDTRASCNHGFTAYLAVLIDRLTAITPNAS